MKKIGFIGLGKMGSGMCRNLIKNGYEMRVYDLSREAMERFKDEATPLEDPVEVFRQSDVTFLSLPSSKEVEELTAKFLKAGVGGKFLIDASTSLPISTKKIYAEFKEKGGHVLDAPLLGGPADAVNGTLFALIGGDKKDFDECEELFKCYCRKYDYVGGSGSGHFAKLAMNFVGLGYTAIYAQVFTLGEKYGINPSYMFDLIASSNMDCRVFRFYGPKIANREYRLDFALELALKDFGYIKKLYEEYNVPAFVLDGILDLLRTGVKDGRGSHDYSECAAVLRDYLKL
ncbi:MAG TPA: NAD(P)-dependent oxidoreductase [Clostridiaceae bacterium]|nr:NAD(P)-dependent oxidoreductase [Clostridiaceae bacterium]